MDPAGQPSEPPNGKRPLRVGATGGSAELAEVRSPDQPAASCGNRSEPPGGGPARPMLFAQKLLAPGPQVQHSGNVNPPQADLRQSRRLTLRKLIGQS